MTDYFTGYADEYKAPPSADSWGDLSVHQLIDIKNKFINQQSNLPRDGQTFKTLERGIERLDNMINNYGR